MDLIVANLNHILLLSMCLSCSASQEKLAYFNEELTVESTVTIEAIVINNDLAIRYSMQLAKIRDYFTRSISVFDWSGKPVKQISTDKMLISVAADEQNNVLYGISVNEGFFSLVKISMEQ